MKEKEKEPMVQDRSTTTRSSPRGKGEGVA